MPNFFLSIKKYLGHNLTLVSILIIGFIFRFYKLYEFQYWSTDEELIAHFAKKIVSEHKLFLISPNFTIAASIGSAFHMFTGLLYWIANLQPERVLILGSLLSFVTMALIYVVGKRLHPTAGIIAATLYAGSFLTSLYDRRWWTLSTGPFLTVFSIYCLVKIFEHQKKHVAFLALCTAGAWQIDPNLTIIPVAIFLIMYFLRVVRFTIKDQLAFYFVIFLSFVPLFIFNLRHPGVLIQPFIKQIHQVAEKQPDDFSSSAVHHSLRSVFLKNIWRFPIVYAQYLFVYPSQSLDANFSWAQEATSYFPTVTAVAIIFMLIVSFSGLIHTSNQNINATTLKIVWIFFIVFIVSLFGFSVVLKKNLGQHFFLVSLPMYYLLIAHGMQLVIRSKYVILIILLLYVAVNTLSMAESGFRYPLYQKQRVVSQIALQLAGLKFSLHTINQGDFVNVGSSGLFILNNAFPVKSSDYDALNWWYRTQSLFFSAPEVEDAERVVVIGPSEFVLYTNYVLYKVNSGTIGGVILDNKAGWFSKKI
mgnify:CR=1 FL=1